MEPVDAQYLQIGAILVTTAGVGQLPAVQRPIELYLAPVGHVATQQGGLAVHYVLVDRRRVEVETVLLLRLRDGCESESGENEKKQVKHRCYER